MLSDLLLIEMEAQRDSLTSISKMKLMLKMPSRNPESSSMKETSELITPMPAEVETPEKEDSEVDSEVEAEEDSPEAEEDSLEAAEEASLEAEEDSLVAVEEAEAEVDSLEAVAVTEEEKTEEIKFKNHYLMTPNLVLF